MDSGGSFVRGPPVLNLRSSPTPPRQLGDESVGIPVTIPAPVGGWNTTSNLASMPAIDAITLENLYPGTDAVKLRGGRTAWATGMTGTVRSLMAHNRPAGKKLFASTDSGIYDVTAGGVVGAAVSACTSGKWQFVNMATSAGNYLVMVNGVDKLKIYDGAAWTNIDAVSAPAITGLATTSIINACLFKHRLWFVENNTLTAWYLPTDSFGGAVTAFPMGPLFKKGGYIVAQFDWTIDGGQGSDDYFVTVTSEGEAAIYQGTDPAGAATFLLVGVFDVGIPVGRKCFMKYGGDVVLLSENGIFPLSKVLLSVAFERTQSLSNKISQAYLDLVTAYRAVTGWQVILYPAQSALIVNVPTADATTSYQLVMNSITKAWCKFLSWDCTCFELFNSALYSGLGTTVYLNWTGTSDNGSSIVGACAQAYNNFRFPGEKHVAMVKPTIQISSTATVAMAIDTDFAAYTGQTLESYLGGSLVVWDTAVWDTSLWDGGTSPYVSQWKTVPTIMGFFHSFRLQITTSTSTFGWISTGYLYKKGGIL